jgi:hypothetical protein
MLLVTSNDVRYGGNLIIENIKIEFLIIFTCDVCCWQFRKFNIRLRISQFNLMIHECGNF